MKRLMLGILAALATFPPQAHAAPAANLIDEIVNRPEETSLLVRRITKEIGPLGAIAEKAKAGKRLTASEKALLIDLATRYRAKPQCNRMGRSAYQLQIGRHIISVMKAIVDLHHRNLASRIELTGPTKKGSDLDSLAEADKLRLQEAKRFSEVLGAYLNTLAPKKRKPT